MAKQERVDPGWNWTRRFGISAGVKLGDTIYLSGIVAFDGDGNVVGEGDLYAQSTRVFGNIAEALASCGASMADVVKITAYLTEMSRYGDYGRARGEAFPGGVPASTTIVSPSLVMPSLLVEVEAMAVIGSASG